MGVMGIGLLFVDYTSLIHTYVGRVVWISFISHIVGRTMGFLKPRLTVARKRNEGLTWNRDVKDF
jgi:hypothetical protein